MPLEYSYPFYMAVQYRHEFRGIPLDIGRVSASSTSEGVATDMSYDASLMDGGRNENTF